MSYLALYRKYRPNNFDDLVGQNSVSSIIKNEIMSDKISHAYLFSGPRGTGKTSTAKIIAKMINCKNLSDDGTPCCNCDSCLNIFDNNDVIEIDAASNNGVDEIRDLRDKVNLVPSCGKYKIYIIDEVHMLTTQAFNALLKTLEEPPAHVIFILATTEFYKIPATVVSRCQKFQFFKFSNSEISSRLSNIAHLEGIDISADILMEIARLSDGGMRDAINMLDQLSSYSDNITIDDLYMLNGVVSYLDLYNFLLYIYNNDVVNIINFINRIDREGKTFDRFIYELLLFLKDMLLIKNDFSIVVSIDDKKNKLVELSKLFLFDDLYNFIFSLNDLDNRIKSSSFSSILVISYFVKMASNINKANTINIVNNVSKSVNSLTDNNIESGNIFIGDNNKNDDERTENDLDNSFDINLKRVRINNSFATASKQLKDDFNARWLDIRNSVDINKYNSIIGFVDDIEVLVVGENNVMFKARYDSLVDRINTLIVEFESFLKEVYNNDYKIVIISSDEWENEKNKYVSNIKKGYIYKYIEESNNDYFLSSSSNDKDIDKLVNILGEDVIVYK